MLSACAAPTPAVRDPNRPLNVVATFSIVGDVVQNVGGTHITLKTLVTAGQDAHTFDPAPGEGKLLTEADLIFEMGLGFEPWLKDLFTAANSKARRIELSAKIEALHASDSADHAESTPDGHDDHGEHDPHLWHDVTNVIQMARTTRDALSQADPAHAAEYQANAEKYITELQTLDQWIFEQVKLIPAERRKLITTHDTFAYFAHRYGFEIIGTVLATSTEGASPSAQEIAELVNTVKQTGVPVIFAENVTSNALLQQVADEAGVRVVGPLYTDALGATGSPGETYIKLMRDNVRVIVEALK